MEKSHRRNVRKGHICSKIACRRDAAEYRRGFKAAGMSLFPASSKDIKTDCSCPDSANPCKHIAAVYYILAEEFDRDPFMLFNLRGRTKEEITVSLGKKRVGDEKPQESQKETEKPKEIPLSADGFWGGGELESFSVNITTPDVPAAIIKRPGTPQFWDSKEDFNKKMEKYYKEISRKAIETAYGDGKGRRKRKNKDDLICQIMK